MRISEVQLNDSCVYIVTNCGWEVVDALHVDALAGV